MQNAIETSHAQDAATLLADASHRRAPRVLLALLCAGCASAGVQQTSTESAHRRDAAAEGTLPVACGAQTCTPPAQCIRYVGIAGPRVPLTMCGIPCGLEPDAACPEGLRCVRAADFPALCERTEAP